LLFLVFLNKSTDFIWNIKEKSVIFIKMEHEKKYFEHIAKK